MLLTFAFVAVILLVTGKAAAPGFAGLAIGLSLTAVHLIGIPLTGTSVNPARSLGPALFAGGEPLAHVWLFIVAPLVGAALAVVVVRAISVPLGRPGARPRRPTRPGRRSPGEPSRGRVPEARPPTADETRATAAQQHLSRSPGRRSRPGCAVRRRRAVWRRVASSLPAGPGDDAATETLRWRPPSRAAPGGQAPRSRPTGTAR